MPVKIRRITVEFCVVLACLLVVMFTAVEILTLNRNKTQYAKHKTWTPNTVAEGPRAQQINEAKKTRLANIHARLKLKHKIRLEIMALERAISEILREKAMTPAEMSEKIENDIYARRVKHIIQTADKEALDTLLKNRPSFTTRKTQNGFSGIPAAVVNRSVLFQDSDSAHMRSPALRFGLPLAFESASTAQEVMSGGVKTKLTFLDNFKGLNASEENRMKEIVKAAENFGEGNFSLMYEDNFQRVKKQFVEGTELYVDEESVVKENGSILEICPNEPESLVGNTTQVVLNISLDIDEVIVNNTDVMDGGEWKPRTCSPRHRVAIIIPYRDRWMHLKVLLYYLIPTLKRQQIHFRIFVVEQYGNETFNKGRIMNAAFREALKLFDFHCVTFHDVDLVPEDDRNMYSCSEQPKHMSYSIDKFKYILPYQGLVGGVLMFQREHFQLVNGYSNMYWGWGAEDDDMTTRILSHGLRIYRTPSNIAKYKMVKHDGRKSSEVSVRMRLLRSAAKRSKLEGLNNVKYRLLDTHIKKLFTHFIVDIGRPY
ncbi:hypothetical protein BsWGS_12406 [Bradybaena similaris]